MRLFRGFIGVSCLIGLFYELPSTAEFAPPTSPGKWVFLGVLAAVGFFQTWRALTGVKFSWER